MRLSYVETPTWWAVAALGGPSYEEKLRRERQEYSEALARSLEATNE